MEMMVRTPRPAAATDTLRRMRRTKIVATIGPASREPETLLRMVQAGMDVARLNYSHGTLEEHAETVRRVRDAADILGIEDYLKRKPRQLSGGQRQRLSVALALIGGPRIAVLDEMTAGLDPQGRREAWRLIEQVRDRGTNAVGQNVSTSRARARSRPGF